MRRPEALAASPSCETTVPLRRTSPLFAFLREQLPHLDDVHGTAEDRRVEERRAQRRGDDERDDETDIATAHRRQQHTRRALRDAPAPAGRAQDDW